MYFLHILLVIIVRIDRMLRNQKIVVLNGERLSELHKLEKPLIFAPNHCGKYDIQIMTEVVKKFSYYLLSGDPYNLPGTIEGTWLKLNGVVYVDRDDKVSRKKSKDELIKLLKSNKSVMLYPEGTWNLSENRLILDLFRGIADIAVETKATIIPFGLEIDDNCNTYFINVGVPLKVEQSSNEALYILRDQMASLRWEIIERYFVIQNNSSNSLSEQWNKYIDKRLSECSYMSYELVLKYARKDDAITEHKEAYSHLDNMVPNKNNSFLFNKRLSG